MRIYATFANRTYDPDVIELVTAWDEFSVDENQSGFEEDRRKALASLGEDLLRWVTVEIDVKVDQIHEYLNPNIKVAGSWSRMAGPAGAAVTEPEETL